MWLPGTAYKTSGSSSGHSAVWSAHLSWEQDVVGSNPSAPTFASYIACGECIDCVPLFVFLLGIFRIIPLNVLRKLAKLEDREDLRVLLFLVSYAQEKRRSNPSFFCTHMSSPSSFARPITYPKGRLSSSAVSLMFTCVPSRWQRMIYSSLPFGIRTVRATKSIHSLSW